MKRICIFLGAWLALFGQAPANGQAGALFETFRIESSLPLQFGTNALLTPTNAKSDFYLSPSMQFTALGTIDKTLSYQVYIGGGPDGYLRVKAANDGATTVGARLDKALGAFTVSGYYESNWIFDGIYRNELFRADDFAGYVSYMYQNSTGLTVTPSFTTTYRRADDINQDRWLFILKSPFNQKVSDKISISLTPALRYFVFTDGTAAGKRNVIPSVVAAVNYKLTNDVGLTGSVEYDRRWSNRVGNDYTNVIFLASVNFAHDYSLPATIRSR
jgi:hypothetical protein